MTSEEKSKAYDEAIKKAAALYKASEPMSGCNVIIETLFPELAESGNEKIRKAIIEGLRAMKSNFHTISSIKIDDAINWLENQGEQKSFDDVAKEITKNKETATSFLKSCGIMNVNGELADEYKIEQGEQKLTDNIEAKFREGDWITNGDYTWKIVNVNPLDYTLQSQDGNIVDDTITHVDDRFHPFTIEDAMDGDILATSAGAFIYNGYNSGGSCPGCYCGISTLGNFKTGVKYHWTGKPVFPAIKEQRELLFQKMKEAGYEWDANKKELKKIVQKPTNSYCRENCKGFQETRKCFADGDCKDKREAEQKSAWSEDDEHRLNDTLYFLDNAKNHYASTIELDDCIVWLKSLKYLNKYSYTFNEIDKEILNAAILFTMNSTDEFACNGVSKEDVIDLLKSLKDSVQLKQKQE